MNKREFKGKSLISFPTDYVVIDIETTGLSPVYDSIIEIAGIKYSSGIEVNRFSSLVRPDTQYPRCSYVDDFITCLTGITNEMLSAAPTTSDVLSSFFEFIGDSVLVGHNVNFDINFLYDNFDQYLSKRLSNNFVDTMRISRNLHPEDKHHSLDDLVDRYSFDYSNAHRALRDCELTHSIFKALHDDACSKYGCIESFLHDLKKSKVGLRAADVQSSNTDFDIFHPLYGKVCVFTGTLERMVRRDAMQIVVDHGGINGDSVTKKTNYLILGNNDYCKSIKDGKSSKQKKAEKLKLDGQDISIIPEDIFYDMIND